MKAGAEVKKEERGAAVAADAGQKADSKKEEGKIEKEQEEEELEMEDDEVALEEPEDEESKRKAAELEAHKKRYRDALEEARNTPRGATVRLSVQLFCVSVPCTLRSCLTHPHTHSPARRPLPHHAGPRRGGPQRAAAARGRLLERAAQERGADARAELHGPGPAAIARVLPPRRCLPPQF